MQEIRSREQIEGKPLENKGIENIKPKGESSLKENRGFWDSRDTGENKGKESGGIEKGEAESKIDNKSIYKDDNGKIYRKGDDLLPRTEFTKDGYDYKTDKEGRVISAQGFLRKPDETSYIKDSMDKVGKGDQKDDDQRGHLIGKRFGGSGEIENLVPMDREVNQRDYKHLENKLADALDAGKTVYLSVKPVYSGNSHRPTKFRVSYTINGEKTVVTFKNVGSNPK